MENITLESLLDRESSYVLHESNEGDDDFEFEGNDLMDIIGSQTNPSSCLVDEDFDDDPIVVRNEQKNQGEQNIIDTVNEDTQSKKKEKRKTVTFNDSFICHRYEEGKGEKEDEEDVTVDSSSNNHLEGKTDDNIHLSEQNTVSQSNNNAPIKAITPVLTTVMENGKDDEVETQKHTNQKGKHLDLSKIEEEWNTITELKKQQNYGKNSGIGAEVDPKYVLITYDEAMNYFRSKEISKEKQKVPENNSNISNILRFFSCCPCGTPLLKSIKLEREKELFFCIAHLQLDHTDEVYERMICTLYRKLTGDPMNPLPIGEHWQIIGFQRTDPATDLRAVGMLGILQLLHFCCNYPSIVSSIYTLSRNTVHGFPFSITSFGFTAMVLGLLRDGTLVPEINQEGDLFSVSHNMYMSLFYRFYCIWKQGKTIRDFDTVKKLIDSESKKNPKSLVKSFKSASKKNQDIQIEKDDGFLDVNSSRIPSDHSGSPIRANHTSKLSRYQVSE